MLSIRHHICIISRRLCCTGELWLFNSLLHLLSLSFAPKEGIVIHKFLCIKNIFQWIWRVFHILRTKILKPGVVDFSEENVLSVNRNRSLVTLFMACCSMVSVWSPNTEIFSLQHPLQHQSCTHCSGMCTEGVCRFPKRVIKLLFLHIYFRILAQICKTKAFQKMNPAEFDLRDEVKEAVLVSNITTWLHMWWSLMKYCRIFMPDRNRGVVFH